MRLKFILSEVAIGLRRNMTMTIAMILTTAISLGLLGTGLLIARQINTMKEIYYDKVQVSIFIREDATDADRQAIEAKLDDLTADDEVQDYFYESKDEAYERFQKQFEAQKDLVENTPKEAIPASYRVTLVNPERYEVIEEAFTDDSGALDPGVDQVRDDGDVLDRLFSVLNGMRNATIAIAIAGAIAACRPGSGTDMLVGIGGTPEGIIAAAAIRCMGGAIQAKLAPKDDEERQKALDRGYDLDRVLNTEDLVSGENVFFCATGVTDGDLLKGVQYYGGGCTTQSIVMRSKSGTVRMIEAYHRLSKLNEYSAVDFTGDTSAAYPLP